MKKDEQEVYFLKRKLINWVRIAGLIAVAGLAAWGLVALGVLHRQSCPELYAPGSSDYVWLYIVLLLLCCLLMPVFGSLGGLLSGYRLHRMQILFIEVTQEDKLRVRLSRRPGWGTILLPPRTDGTSPYVLALLSAPLTGVVLAVLCLALAAIFWHTGPARALLIVPAACLGLIVVVLLPRRNGADILSRLLAFRNRDKLRAYECAMHIIAAQDEGKKLMDMPEEWFQQYPAEVADDLYVSNCIVSGSSRLIRQRRFAEGYDMLRPCLGLAPTPETHQLVACTILNGAICEALADIPACCLNQLEHESVKYMLPANWTPRLLTAKYARALFIDHDEAAAAALLGDIGTDPDTEQIDADLLRLMQEKAGLTTKEATP